VSTPALNRGIFTPSEHTLNLRERMFEVFYLVTDTEVNIRQVEVRGCYTCVLFGSTDQDSTFPGTIFDIMFHTIYSTAVDQHYMD